MDVSVKDNGRLNSFSGASPEVNTSDEITVERLANGDNL
jgi:hypothetical protein